MLQLLLTLEILQEPTIDTSEEDEEFVEGQVKKKSIKGAFTLVEESNKISSGINVPEEIAPESNDKKDSVKTEQKTTRTKSELEGDLQMEKQADDRKSDKDVIKPLQKPEKKMTMEEKIAAQKTKKGLKEEESVFVGMKLKKSKPVQRELPKDGLQVVELKAHKFEQFLKSKW